ncbi:DUF1292 domain-containing protein [Bacillota bacterium LX-D]|nr:DUF1292 domain-containing protein [Bacillota bacterium LX-D]
MVDEKHHDCGCEEDCECEDIIVLQDEEGNDHEFSIVDVLEMDENKYAILMPASENDESDEAIILKIAADENGDEFLAEIENDDEWESVARAWEEMIDEEEF